MSVPLICRRDAGMLYVENDAAIRLTRPRTRILHAGLLRRHAGRDGHPQVAARRQVAASTELTIARATQDAVSPRMLPQWNELMSPGTA
jgi:hypothetical protein